MKAVLTLELNVPTLELKVCKLELRWAIWYAILRLRAQNPGLLGVLGPSSLIAMYLDPLGCTVEASSNVLKCNSQRKTEHQHEPLSLPYINPKCVLKTFKRNPNSVLEECFLGFDFAELSIMELKGARFYTTPIPKLALFDPCFGMGLV